eukprot:jgi/Mesen1/7433/ME000388S06646
MCHSPSASLARLRPRTPLPPAQSWLQLPSSRKRIRQVAKRTYTRVHPPALRTSTPERARARQAPWACQVSHALAARGTALAARSTPL